MIVCLYGVDSYRRNGKLRELIVAYREKRPAVDMFSVDLEENPDDWARAADFLHQPSLFETSKLLLVKEFGFCEEKSWKKMLQAYVDDRGVFIFLSQANTPTKAFQFLLKEPVVVQKFEELSGAFLESFLKKEAGTRGLAFAPDAFRFFSLYISSLKTERSWEAMQALEKISLAGFAQPISASDIKTIIDYKEQEAVFMLARKILFARDVSSRLVFLEKLFRAADPAYAFNSLAYQACGDALVRFADYDVAVKSGKLEYEEALLEFVVSSE